MKVLAQNVHFNNLSFTLLNLSTLLRRIIILLLYVDCQSGRTAAIARHVRFFKLLVLLTALTLTLRMKVHFILPGRYHELD